MTARSASKRRKRQRKLEGILAKAGGNGESGIKA